MASEYGWTIDYILNLPTKQAILLLETISRNRYERQLMSATLNEASVLRALAQAFGDKKLPAWPSWEDVTQEHKLHPAMEKLKKVATTS